MRLRETCESCGSTLEELGGHFRCAKCLVTGVVNGRAPETVCLPQDRTEQFGNYEVLERIGGGGMGVVYKARQLRLNREVALKLILPANQDNPDAIQRFNIEAQAAAKLQHPNIVPIYEIGGDGGRLYLSMQLVDGTDLHKRLGEFSLPPASKITSGVEARQRQEKIVALMEKIARAVHFAHQNGVLHRDLKPQNILVTWAGEPFLTDFGLAKMIDSDHTVSITGKTLGTPSYMAPEQAAGKLVGPAADIFSLGAIFYQLLTQTRPFKGQTQEETLRKLAEEEAINPKVLNRWVDRDLATICLMCLEKSPKARYATAEDFADDLRAWLNYEPIKAQASSIVWRTRKWVGRNKDICIYLSLATLFLGWGAWAFLEYRAKVKLQEGFARALQRKWEEVGNRKPAYITIDSFQMAALTGKKLTNPGGPRLKIGLYDEQEGSPVQQFAPLLQAVQKAMTKHFPVQIDLVLYLQREDMEKAFEQGEIDIVRIGEGPLVRMRRKNPYITPLAQQKSGGKTSVVYTARSSGITELPGIKGGRFAAGNETSTSSGFRLLQVLLGAGIRARDLKEFKFHRESEETPPKILNREFDAGVTRLGKAAGSFTNYFRVLKEFKTTTMPWAARKDLDQKISGAFTVALVKMTDKEILKNLPQDASQGFERANIEEFNKLDKLMKQTYEDFWGRSEPVK